MGEIKLVAGVPTVSDCQLMYFFVLGIEPDMQAKLVSNKLTTLADTVKAAWGFKRKTRSPQKVIMVGGSSGSTIKPINLDALRYGNSPF